MIDESQTILGYMFCYKVIQWSPLYGCSYLCLFLSQVNGDFPYVVADGMWVCFCVGIRYGEASISCVSNPLEVTCHMFVVLFQF